MWTMRAGLVALVALSAACGASRSSPASPAPKPSATSAQTEESGTSKTRVDIDNQNFSDMDIYLIDRGTRVLLGSATGLSKTTLEIPTGAARSSWQIRLLADPIGDGLPISTPSLLVAPGQNVYWTIGSNPSNSFASAG